MIKLKEILSESNHIHSGDKLYSGRLGNDDKFDDWRPAFFTKNIKDASFFATPSVFTKNSGIPMVIEAKVVFKNSCDWDLLENVGEELKVTDSEVNKYIDTNNGVVDFLYVPRVLKKLEMLGYDSYVDVDVLLDQHISVAVVWHKNQIHILNILG